MRNSWTATCVLMFTLSAQLYAAEVPPKGSAEQPVATFETSMGNLTCVLFPKAAPEGTANFIGLARGTKVWIKPGLLTEVRGVPLYDGTIFHRVIPEFMIQGGDPRGTGTGDPGYEFKDETWPDLRFDQPGRLAYANKGPNTNGSQFFITETPQPSLDGKYTIFGQCDDASVELVKQIARQPRDNKDFPDKPVVVKHIRIDDGTTPKATAKKPATKKKAVGAQ
jgi:peptidyl-prolyl cis-trans isomerase A (cyclophilin A)